MLCRLVQSNLHGIENLEAATQTPLAELLRQWWAALAVADSGAEVEGVTPLRGIPLRHPLGNRLLCGPRWHELKLGGGDRALTVAPTAAAYFLLHSPGGARSCVTVTADAGADVQVSLVRLPRPMGRLALRCTRDANGEVRLALTATNAAVQLEEAAWERAITRESAVGDTSYCARPAGESARHWFGAARLQAGETRRSTAVVLPNDVRTDEVVFKVVAVDSAGRRVAG